MRKNCSVICASMGLFLVLWGILCAPFSPPASADPGGRRGDHSGRPPQVGGLNPGHSNRGGRHRGARRPPEHRRRDWIVHPGSRRGDATEESIRDLWAEEANGMRCEQLSELLVRVTQRVLRVEKWTKGPRNDPSLPPGFHRGGSSRDIDWHRRRWTHHFRSKDWWEQFWRSLVEAYRSCEVDCFDDGQVVGQISAVGYCSLSEALGGLNQPGFLTQKTLPVCETATYAGCVSAYRDTAASIGSCRTYLAGTHEQVFSEFVSQDCSP